MPAISRGMTIRQPAGRWEDALPSGNGAMGALVFGSIAHEAVVMNHEALWVRDPKPELPDVSHHVPELRKLLAEGRYKDAEQFLNSQRTHVAGSKPDASYHPAFALTIENTVGAPFRDYRRTLDFTTGEAAVSWTEHGLSFRRESFVSRADDLFVMRFKGERDLTCTIAIEPYGAADDCPVSFDVSADNDIIWLIGTYPDGTKYAGVARVFAGEGTITTYDDRIGVAATKEITIVIGIETDESAFDSLQTRMLRVSPAGSADGEGDRKRTVTECAVADYDVLLYRHVALHGEMFDRVRLDLPGLSSSTTEEMLMTAYDGDVPAALIHTMFDYGRYLLISSSCETGWPANLQGIWNGLWRPPWQSDFHNDENVQMNYWAALPGNLPETVPAYFDYYERMIPDYRDNARKLYNCRGILAPIAQTVDGRMYPGVWTNWTGAAGWLSQLFFDYWLFSGDVEFLRDRAVPFMKEVALFYEDFLFEVDGKLVFSPSLSPENEPSIPDSSLITINATMDVAIAREIFGNLLSACELLGIETDGVSRWREMLAKLPDYETNEDGAIAEWIHPDLHDNYHHRHQSHIYPLFPGIEVTRETSPEMFEACRIAIEKRLVIGLSSQSGWSYAHMANVYARLGEGERALEALELITRSCVGANLFTYHNDWREQGLTVSWFRDARPAFQIDANFGLTAAVLEMLVFSVPGMIKLLPALPPTWRSGGISGVKCRGNVEVSVRWDMDTGMIESTFLPASDGVVTIMFPGKPLSLTCEGAEVGNSPHGDCYRELTFTAGERVHLTVGLG
jgi:alpha-L-fucosidase 2